jgi:hypothetical protein
MGGLFGGGGGGKQQQQKAAVTRMPVQNNVSFQRAVARSREQAAGRSGRASTIMTVNLNRSRGKLGT